LLWWTICRPTAMMVWFCHPFSWQLLRLFVFFSFLWEVHKRQPTHFDILRCSEEFKREKWDFCPASKGSFQRTNDTSTGRRIRYLLGRSLEGGSTCCGCRGDGWA
jgi:hypothetical protein